MEENAENDNKPKQLVEFTLKPGVHKILFTPNYMAVQHTGKLTAVINEVAKGRDKDTNGFLAASRNEGSLSGYIGLKSEKRGASEAEGKAFSLTDRGKRCNATFVSVDDRQNRDCPLRNG